MQAKLLLVDDEWVFSSSSARFLTRKGFVVREAGTLAAAKAAMAADSFNAVLLDLDLPDGNGIDWVEELRATYPGLAIVVITGRGDVPTAVEAMKRGVDHFLSKPIDLAELELFLKRSLEVGQLRRRNAAHQRLEKRIEPFFGISELARQAQELAVLAAESDAVVLMSGETGTGKGLMANWIHQRSRRRAQPLVEVNCSMLRGELLASELFGHARGAFTSATESRSGLLDTVDGGTLFLDEIGDMEPSIQVQFLKLIEEKRYRRLGETNVRHSDFRLICATHHDLAGDVAAGRFRADLYYRLNVLPIHLPASRETPEDFRPLVAYLLAGFGATVAHLERGAMEMLETYDWPGNTRELKNVLERALLMARGQPVGKMHLRGIGRARPAQRAASTGAPSGSAQILAALDRCSGDKERAARELGLSRATLYRRLRAFECAGR
ncbi:MAG TPA: sigma-54 dependent transcriptional regulator [Thermoanaerobaculia bacterium]|nr:sigma-54 dependent transcriptional regulator [Thermoanaerobaculia bacterium]